MKGTTSVEENLYVLLKILRYLNSESL